MVLGFFDFLRLNCENLFFVFVFCFLFFRLDGDANQKGATYALMDIYDLIMIIVTVYLLELSSI